MKSTSLLGVYVNSNSNNGVIIENTIKNTGAIAAGFQSGDKITTINGVDVRTYNELRKEITAHKPGEIVTVTFSRGGEKQIVNATLSSLADTRQEVILKLEQQCNSLKSEPIALPGKPVAGIQNGEISVEAPLLTVSPNPSSGIVILHFSGDEKQTSSVSVNDLQGKQILMQSLAAGTIDTSLDLTSFPKGVYVVTVSQNGHDYSEKVVIN